MQQIPEKVLDMKQVTMLSNSEKWGYWKKETLFKQVAANMAIV
jgi:hypothetical protein